MGLFWLRTGYMTWRTGGRHTPRIRNGLSLQSALERTHSVSLPPFNWIISPLQISARKCRSTCNDLRHVSELNDRLLHVHNSLIVAQISLEFDTTTFDSLRSILYIFFFFAPALFSFLGWSVTIFVAPGSREVNWLKQLWTCWSCHKLKEDL